MKKIILFYVFLIFSLNAFAIEELVITSNKDTQKILVPYNKIFMGTMVPCVMGEPKAKSETEKAKVLKICACRHEKGIKRQVDNIDEIIAKNPTWKDKKLIVKDDNSTTKINLEQVSKIKKDINSCEPQEMNNYKEAKNTCDNLSAKLKVCETFECEYPNLFGSSSKRKITGLKDGKCHYKDFLPQDIVINCQFDETSKNSFADALEKTLENPESDANTILAKIYNNSSICQTKMPGMEKQKCPEGMKPVETKSGQSCVAEGITMSFN